MSSNLFDNVAIKLQRPLWQALNGEIGIGFLQVTESIAETHSSVFSNQGIVKVVAIECYLREACLTDCSRQPCRTYPRQKN